GAVEKGKEKIKIKNNNKRKQDIKMFRCHSSPEHRSHQSNVTRRQNNKQKKKKKIGMGITDMREGFKKIEDYLMHKRILKEMSSGAIVEGSLINRMEDGIVIRLYSVYDYPDTLRLKYTHIDRLKIDAIGLYSELMESEYEQENSHHISAVKQQCEQFELGSKVKGMVLKVDYHTGELFITCHAKKTLIHPFHQLVFFFFFTKKKKRSVFESSVQVTKKKKRVFRRVSQTKKKMKTDNDEDEDENDDNDHDKGNEHENDHDNGHDNDNETTIFC
ncbi:hypothetical protein RFI_30190, partial [Reticulomyxa filosa]